MKIFIYVTLSLNPFPLERDLPSLRSKLFYRVYFNSMSVNSSLFPKSYINMKIFIYVTLSLNPFPLERDLPSLRSKLFYRVYFNSMSVNLSDFSICQNGRGVP